MDTWVSFFYTEVQFAWFLRCLAIRLSFGEDTLPVLDQYAFHKRYKALGSAVLSLARVPNSY